MKLQGHFQTCGNVKSKQEWGLVELLKQSEGTTVWSCNQDTCLIIMFSLFRVAQTKTKASIYKKQHEADSTDCLI